MKNYFISYSIQYEGGNIGFSWSVLQLKYPIADHDLRSIEKTILHSKKDETPKPVKIVILNFRLMDAQ